MSAVRNLDQPTRVTWRGHVDPSFTEGVEQLLCGSETARQLADAWIPGLADFSDRPAARLDDPLVLALRRQTRQPSWAHRRSGSGRRTPPNHRRRRRRRRRLDRCRRPASGHRSAGCRGRIGRRWRSSPSSGLRVGALTCREQASSLRQRRGRRSVGLAVSSLGECKKGVGDSSRLVWAEFDRISLACHGLELN
jgi:hypothetical protein